jgi:hypothetical protein
MTLDRPWLVVAGLCCIFCPSLGMLAASYYNRSGPPLSVLPLTERELRLPSSENETAEGVALTLGLMWRVEGMGHTDFGAQQPYSTPVKWMNAEKRAELGVKPQDWRSAVPAFLVLEFNGRSYAQALKQTCRSGDTEVCLRVRNSESRLYVIDAGTDANALRQEYPNPGVYAIVHGIVKFNGTRDDVDSPVTIGEIDVETVQAIEPLRSAKNSSGEMSWYQQLSGKPFTAEIAFGHRDEPWNLSMSFGAHANPPPMELPLSPGDARVEIEPNGSVMDDAPSGGGCVIRWSRAAGCKVTRVHAASSCISRDFHKICELRVRVDPINFLRCRRKTRLRLEFASAPCV